ncbi:phenylalanyl-tRNA synthetase alpha subunit [Orenia metallireducens]|uniref:Phenylalanine--tRNA ligase alpha subunit n=1 Tax=Orenia metallireducens TaxID=1413210 RepID=A0A285GX59_9FIRM|nr:phenylalanine--tRNA ligase subunit alpha [Orenia metallireducens]PRX25289.1 phenylalanyl-tRNA synthetase alpha subunit [Orenia metallireducens]SNY27126.1 phenylalanyl-tRNA synthetase, alpha subunit [Orenia metallireducens]
MEEKIRGLQQEAIDAIKTVDNLERLEELRIKYLGKKGELTQILRGMGSLSPEERPVVGKLVNIVKGELNKLLSEKEATLKELAKQERLKSEGIDVTLPGKRRKLGKQHPLTLAFNEIKELFLGLGFEIAEGPEVEKDYYNFEALNFPANHPARDMQDTFYVGGDVLLRTHTSGVQVRTMEKTEPPIRVIAPGRVYRSDEVDATHSPVFHQVEGLMIDKDISFANLKAILIKVVHELFGTDREVRFRPSYFPFTEPSAEVDVSCASCGGEGCRICSGTGWLEILGSGMVHPNVLEMSGIDSEEYSGFAFGIGVERIAMLKYGIDDMRLLYENDIRFLEQF